MLRPLFGDGPKLRINPLGGVDFWVTDRNVNGEVFVCAPSGLRKVDSGAEPLPTFSLSLDAAEELITRLWDVGLRPRGFARVAEVEAAGPVLAALSNPVEEAQREHIADLRRMLFERGEK